MAKIIWSPRAVKDIKEIAEYIAKDSTQYAKEQVKLFFRQAEVLEEYPYLGRMVPELNISSIRQVLCGHYRIIYEVPDKNHINILTIHHQACLLKNNPVFRKPRKK